MAGLLIGIVVAFVGVGVPRAVTSVKYRRRAIPVLLADPAPAAGHALRLLLAVGRLPAWKRWTLAVCAFLVDVTTWPVDEVLVPIDRQRRPEPWRPLFRDTRWAGSEVELTPEYASRDVRRRSLTTAAVSAVLFLTAGRLVTDALHAVQITLVTWVVVAGVGARQVQDLLAEKFVSTVARRSGRPLPTAYRDVLVTGAADLVTLSLGAVLLLNWAPGAPLRAVWFWEQLMAVVNGGHLPEAVRGSPAAVLVGLASVSFGASLLGPLKNAIGRRRSGDDLVAAADSEVRRGHPDRARLLLDRGRGRDPSIAAVARVDGLLAVSDDRMADAWAEARTLVRQRRARQNLDQLRQDEDGLVVLHAWCRELGVTPRPGILETARDVPVRDSMLACLLANGLTTLLPGSVPGTRAAALESILDPEAWPLTFSVVHEREGDTEAAERILPAADRVTGLDLLWRNQLARGRARGAPASGRARIESDARALLADIAASDVATWPEWHRIAFARALSAPLVLGERAGLDRHLASELVATRTAVAGDLADDAEIAVWRNMISGRG